MTGHHKSRLTAGIREAYAAGLNMAMPTGPHELGYAMEPR
jgi:hypothetical protein